MTWLEGMFSLLGRSLLRAHFHMVAGRVARAARWLQQLQMRGGTRKGLDRIWAELGEAEDEELV